MLLAIALTRLRISLRLPNPPQLIGITAAAANEHMVVQVIAFGIMNDQQGRQSA